MPARQSSRRPLLTLVRPGTNRSVRLSDKDWRKWRVWFDTRGLHNMLLAVTTHASSPGPTVVPSDKVTLVRLIVLLFLYLTVAGFAGSEFIRYPGLANAAPQLGGEDFFGDMVYGRAPRPFVTRVLVPWLIQAASAVTPAAVRARVESDVRRQLGADRKPEWLYRYPFEFVMAKNLALLFATGFAFAFWWLARLTLEASGPAVDAVPVVTLFVLPGLYGYASHLYDLPALCLFTLGLALIAGRRFWLYVLVFAVATLNKETALLLTFVWLIAERRRLRPPKLLTGLALQVLVWGLIRGGLLLLFRDNPGEPISFRLVRNMHVVVLPGFWLQFRPVTDWLVLPAGLNVLYVLGFAASLFALRRAPQFLRDAFWVVIPISVLTLLFGNLGETRVWYELLPIVTLVLFGGLYRLMGYVPRLHTTEPTTPEPGRSARRGSPRSSPPSSPS